jgi:uncharacterized protein
VSDIPNLLDLPEDFDSRVRLFPLPGLVAFPHVVQPLRIFEPRYCEMLTEALATDQLITMATLEPGWEQGGTAVPRVNTAGCIGRILVHTPRHDGTHQILLLGIRRCAIREDIPVNKAFRTARVEVLEDIYQGTASSQTSLKKKLLQLFSQYVSAPQLMQQNLSQLADDLLSLGPVTDLVAFGAALPLQEKLSLLADPDVVRRAGRLIELLEADGMGKITPPTEEPPSRFPPPFSLN